MELDLPLLRVTAPIEEIQFLCLDDNDYGILTDIDRCFLQAITKYCPDQILPSKKGVVWSSKQKLDFNFDDDSGEIDIEFGGASEVYNQIAQGRYDPCGEEHREEVVAATPQKANPPPAPPPAVNTHVEVTNSPRPFYGAQRVPMMNHISYPVGGIISPPLLASEMVPRSCGGRPPLISHPPPPPPYIQYPYSGGGGAAGAHYHMAAAAGGIRSASPHIFNNGQMPHYQPPLVFYTGQQAPFPQPGIFLPTSVYPSVPAARMPIVQQPPLQQQSPMERMVSVPRSSPVVPYRQFSSDEDSTEERRSWYKRSRGKPGLRGKYVNRASPTHNRISSPLVFGGQNSHGNSPGRYYPRDQMRDVNNITGGDGHEIIARRKSSTNSINSDEWNSNGVRSQRNARDESEAFFHTDDENVPASSEKELDRLDSSLGSNISSSEGGDAVASAEQRSLPPRPFSNLGTETPTTSVPSINYLADHDPVMMPADGQQINADCTSKSMTTKSWSSLFTDKNKQNVELIPVDKGLPRIPPFPQGVTATERADGDSQSARSHDHHAAGAFLAQYELINNPPSILPRGLANRANWCFVNAVLQALLNCPPLFNLMRGLPAATAVSATPMLDCFARFVREFSPTESIKRYQRNYMQQTKQDFPVGDVIDPSYVYECLLNLDSETFEVVEGRQEDAEEFLCCLLNMLEEETCTLMKQAQSMSRNVKKEAESVEESVMSPIRNIFAGKCRSIVKSSGKPSTTTQMFYTLQLDIQSSTVNSVSEALRENFSPEQLHGYVCPDTKEAVEAERTLSLEQLPPILILHLKRLVYDGDTHDCRKIMKRIKFDMGLEVEQDLLSEAASLVYSAKERQYRLFSVVYHNGVEAHKGHYVTDIFHFGYSCWMRCDDSSIRPINEESVRNPAVGSVPYLLFYRRTDL